ncbi:MAG TPA: hypothetical protein VFS37_02955 [Conexibacter sp.]|nr:hypothetical protein [Conexibacter sp.]
MSSSNVGPVGWEPAGELPFEDWVAMGKRFGAMGRGSQWWIADWIRYGNERFGQRYVRATAITGYDVQTLMNLVYVASRFQISRRREKLSWSHHEAVAALDAAEQERWLERAIADRLSVADLRLELRRARQREEHHEEPHAAADAGEPVCEGATLTCPRCGSPVPVTGGAGGGEAR